MYLRQYKSQSYPLPFRYRRGLGCACRQRPLGDPLVDLLSLPYNLWSGKLTDAQNEQLTNEGQAQIMAVANSRGAQSSPAVQTATMQAALQQSGQVSSDTAAILAFPAPSNSAIDLSLLETGLGAQPNQSFLSNYLPIIIGGVGIWGLLALLK
jgi:hypothetical protein